MVGALTSTVKAQDYRVETDLLGEIKVPADSYYGAQAARAMENFQISGQYIIDYPDFMKAWGMIKLACARANTEAGKMSAGTSTNMNANEVLANIALEKAGYKKGEYDKISPNDELKMSQSTNDTYPTSLKLTMLLHNDRLIEQLALLAKSFRKLGDKYLDVVKMGVNTG